MATNAETYYFHPHSTCEPQVSTPPSVLEAFRLRVFPKKVAAKTIGQNVGGAPATKEDRPLVTGQLVTDEL